MIVAAATSAVSGSLAIDLPLRYVRRNTTYIFVRYRIGLGLLLPTLLAAGILGRRSDNRPPRAGTTEGVACSLESIT